MRWLSGVWGIEAGAGCRLESWSARTPLDDKLDADNEDQEAHDTHDRADASRSQPVDPGRRVAQKQCDGGGRDEDAQDDADVKTDGGVTGGQRDDDAD